MAYPIPSSRRMRLFWLMLVLTLVVAVIMRRPLATPVTPAGIVDLELAGSTQRASEVLAAWDANGVRGAAIANVWIDFIWLLLYSTTISLGCMLVASGLSARGLVRMARIGLVLAWAQWLAALLDAVENIAMLRMLYGAVGTPWPTIAMVSAYPKFALVLAGLLYILLGGCALLLIRTRRVPSAAA